MNAPVYNKIGIGYNNTRKADPYIAERIIAHLQPQPGGIYLDIGCGTGNYLQYINQKGFSFCGVDPSEIMLDIAKKKCSGCKFLKGVAEKIPAEDYSFDGAMAIFTLHHWGNQQQGLNELYRVLKQGSKIVFLSFTAEQMNEYWLVHYFPQMIKRSGELVPDKGTMKNMLQLAGFSLIE
ncbi:MAG: methyltransferase domain-containing protein, partial [Bacteroidia bacterium]|nr:methyltransferase domain-containing protein [Bacteroidia bacterium]